MPLRIGFWPGKALVRPFITKLYWAAIGSRSPSNKCWRVAAPVRRAAPLFLVAPDHRLGGRETVAGILVAQVLLAELAGRGVRKRLDELDRVGQPPFGDLAGEERADLGFANFASGVAHDQKQRALVPLR